MVRAMAGGKVSDRLGEIVARASSAFISVISVGQNEIRLYGDKHNRGDAWTASSKSRWKADEGKRYNFGYVEFEVANSW